MIIWWSILIIDIYRHQLLLLLILQDSPSLIRWLGNIRQSRDSHMFFVRKITDLKETLQESWVSVLFLVQDNTKHEPILTLLPHFVQALSRNRKMKAAKAVTKTSQTQRGAEWWHLDINFVLNINMILNNGWVQGMFVAGSPTNINRLRISGVYHQRILNMILSSCNHTICKVTILEEVKLANHHKCNKSSSLHVSWLS